MKFVHILIATMILAACGRQDNNSALYDSNNRTTFAAQFANNSGTDFQMLSGHQDLSVTSSYIHVPANNLYGNRYLITDLKVKNITYAKQIEIAVNGQWRKASFSELPSWGGPSGQAYARYNGSDNGMDKFSVLLHDIIYTALPTVELKVVQENAVQYVKFSMKKQDRSYGQNRAFATTVSADQVKVSSVSFSDDTASSFIKVGLDVADLDDRKLVQVECVGCTGGDQYKKTLRFISRAEANTKAGLVFESEAGGREQVSLYLSLPATRPENIKSLRITYLAPGYFGTPTLGSQDGVYGKPYITVINL